MSTTGPFRNPQALSSADRAVRAAGRVPATPARSWLRRKGWLLLTIPLGFTTWAAFVYIGVRARRPRWLAWAALYAGLLAGFIVLDSPAHPSSSAMGLAATLGLLCWVGGGIHAVAISNDAERRMGRSFDPALDAARRRIERRAEGRRLLERNPALAKEVGVGRPDRPGADSFGLVDVNHAGAQALARLPGVTAEMAHQIIDARSQTGPFSSVEDMGALLQLPPHVVDQMRDQAVFVSD